MSEYITTTISTCASCGCLVPAKVVVESGTVWFEKYCPADGSQTALVSSDAQAYLGLARYHRQASMPLLFQTSAEKGCPRSCGLCPEHEQHVCLPIIEITDHCDLECPICLVRNKSSFHMTREDVSGILDRLIASEGRLDVVNLSGGEPTTNPHFRDIVEECLSREEITCVSVSTNGLGLSRDESLLEFLVERRVVISLQFDGFEPGAYRTLRGAEVLNDKLRLIDRASELDARMSLTATVAAGVNEGEVSRIAGLLFERDNVLSAMFQPAAYTGRAASDSSPVSKAGRIGVRHPWAQEARKKGDRHCRDSPRPRPIGRGLRSQSPFFRAATETGDDSGGASMGPDGRRVTIPDVIRLLDGAAGGKVRQADFSPLPCSHPACFSLAFYLRAEAREFVSIKGLMDTDRYLDMIRNRALFGTDEEGFEKAKEAVYDLWSGPSALTPDSQKAISAVRRIIENVGTCGAFSPPKALSAVERSIKSIFIHHFMDRHNFDLARARKCCNVYPLRDGRMMPACVYNCLER